MFALPAQTAEGRRAKANVLLCLMDDYIAVDDDDHDNYPLGFVRNLLIELGAETAQVRPWI
jgi:hypothetical protein